MIFINTENTQVKTENEKPAFNQMIYALSKLCKVELVEKGIITENMICGYNRKSIKAFLCRPHSHSNAFIKMIRHMYIHSGYFQKIIHYYSNLPLAECWTVDTEIKTPTPNDIDILKFKKDFFNYLYETKSYMLESEVSKILHRVFLYDVCYGYKIETGEGKTMFYFEPEDCVITGRIDGIPMYAVKKPSLKSKKIKTYPQEIQILFETANDLENYRGYVQIPYQKAFCLKYHDTFDFVFPPFFFIIKEILDIEDFKDLEKTRVENEIYKILALKIPTNDDGQIALGDELVTPFAQLANDIVANSIGILPTPFEVIPVEFSTNTTNNINNVQNAIDEMYSELGVSKSILSGATSGSEVKLGVQVDADEAFRVLKQVDRLINFHNRIKFPHNPKYSFSFRYLKITSFNQQTIIDELFKLAQASCPVKFELMASMGYNPVKTIGSEFIENTVFDLANVWTPMKTSYTQSASDSEENGRPKKDETEISDITQTTQKNDGNDPDNRI